MSQLQDGKDYLLMQFGGSAKFETYRTFLSRLPYAVVLYAFGIPAWSSGTSLCFS